MDDVDTMRQRSRVVVYQMYVLGNLTLAGWRIRNYMMLLTVLLLVLRSSVLSLLLSGTNKLNNEFDLLPDSRVCSSSDGLTCGLVDATALVDGCVSVDLNNPYIL